MKKIKKYLLVVLILGGLFGFTLLSLAHPGRTDSSGCHTCRTNCYEWGLSYGEYHCHQSKGLPQPEYPITCQRGIGCEPAPQYELPEYYSPYDYPSIPDCPLNSYYDSISESCKCYSGYVASGGKCISADQYCRDKFGFNARYNILTDSCECSYGYVISGGRCVDGDSLCHNKHGYNSSYDSSTNSCECDYGYIFNATDQCVSKDDYCQNKYGYHSEYNSLGSGCKCKYGYVFNSSMTKCIDGDSYCQDNYGYYSNYDSLSNTCECDYGYEFKNDKCSKVESDTNYVDIESLIAGLKAPVFESDTSSVLGESTINIPEGALIRAKSGIDIYIVKYVGSKKFKRLILNPDVFNMYGHLRWKDVMDIDKSIVDSFITSTLVRAVSDERVWKLYPQGDTGEKRWVKTASVLTNHGWDWDSIYEINTFDRNSYITGADITQ